jgi:ubiquinone/menaquinone biosynthesis C-methylase UbiE
MRDSDPWRGYWEKSPDISDFEFDRGASPRRAEIEHLSGAELTAFIDPKPSEVVLDAGCGAGTSVLLLAPKARRIVAMDYAASAVTRCSKRVMDRKLSNVALLRGDVRSIPLPDSSVDKVISISVLQYIDDIEVRQAFQEFRRVTRPGGFVVLHVKNLMSLYLSTLLMAKRLKRLLGRSTKQEYLRSSGWYLRELEAEGFEIVAYNSFNVLMMEGMPKWLLERLQHVELSHYHRFPLRTRLLRRLGSEFKVKARVRDSGTR